MTQIYLEEFEIVYNDKDGNPYVYNGNPSPRIKARVDGKSVGGFLGKWNSGWKAGETVEARIEERNGYTNLKCPDHLMPKKYPNQSKPNPSNPNPLQLQIDELNKRISAVEAKLVQRREPNEPPPFNSEDDLEF